MCMELHKMEAAYIIQYELKQCSSIYNDYLNAGIRYFIT
jgi:hypothetical protein